MAHKNRKRQRLKVVNSDCAGIDIGKDRHFVAVEMNVRLDSVIADITGQTGVNILRAIVDGERDSERLDGTGCAKGMDGDHERWSNARG